MLNFLTFFRYISAIAVQNAIDIPLFSLMKLASNKSVISLLAAVFLWSTFAMVQAQAGIGKDSGSAVSPGAAQSSAKGDVHSMIADMHMPSTADMHCGEASGGGGCGSHCSLCCASFIQFCFPDAASAPGVMSAPACSLAGIASTTLDRPPRTISV